MDSKGFLGNAITTLITLLSSFLLTGCYTFYVVPAADFQDNPKHGRVEIILKNADKISVEEGQSLLFDPAQNVLLIQKDSSASKINFENIREVKEEKLNIQKTFFSALWLGGLSLVALGLILLAFVHPGKMS